MKQKVILREYFNQKYLREYFNQDCMISIYRDYFLSLSREGQCIQKYLDFISS